MSARGVEALFIPGQQLATEAENLMQQLRNCGARLNRLKLARASPDAALWWQFLSSADGSSESLDRSAFELHCVLRDLEHATSDLKRLCVAPASDVAGNVQHEMAKKRWGMATLDRWAGVLKSATAKRTEAEVENMRTVQQQQQKQAPPLKASGAGDAAETSGESAATTAAVDAGTAQREREREQRRSQALMAMSPQQQQLVKKVLDSQIRVEQLREQLETIEEGSTSSLRLAEKFRELEQLETRFGNVRTRRRQFQAQVQAHLQGMGEEIAKEATRRWQRAREYYDDHHPVDLRPTAADEEEEREQREQQRRRKLRGPRTEIGKSKEAVVSADSSPATAQSDAEEDDDRDAFFCDCCRRDYKTIQALETECRAKWVNRAVRVLCTQNVDPKQLRADAKSVLPAQRLLALVGSRKDDGTPAVVVPLQPRGSGAISTAQRVKATAVTSADHRDAVWHVPSAHDHSKFWSVHLAI